MRQTCKGCKERSVEPNCHSYCDSYLTAKAEHTALAQHIRDTKQGRYNCLAHSTEYKGWR